MIDTILGRKIGMTQLWNEQDEVVPVTVIEAGPCVVSQVKTKETDGYDAVQIGFEEAKPSRVNKPMAGHFKNAGVKAFKFLREVRVDDASQFEVGQEVTVEDFAEVEKVHVTGTTKGKGFQGTVRRYGFSTGPNSHGSRFHRTPGSVGNAAQPARIFKGKKMPGRMGNDRRTIQNLELVRVDEQNNLLFVKGSIPGGKNALVSVRMA